MASVKVAVRVRPLNKRERDLESKVIIKMEEKKTSITNPQEPDKSVCSVGYLTKLFPGNNSLYKNPSDVKDFTFDHSYWSTDSRDRHFVAQEQVFDDLGKDVLNSAFEGYNACIFAYGQTGAGKSYTMMGCQDAIGLIPRICEGMYERIGKAQAENENKVEFKSEVSYLEIYNERVRDLLRAAPKKGDVYNLKVREHPKEGPYVQDLTKHIVTKYSDIEKLMDVGNDNRTTASTNMNDTSSRSHAIFTINFTQLRSDCQEIVQPPELAKFFTDMPSETVSKIHLVDLAGSNIPSGPSYGVYISQLIRYARCCSHYDDFRYRHKCLVDRLLSQGYRALRLEKSFKKFYGRYQDLIEKYRSERANATGATGQRLKEGANINKSLVTLGNVISALAELSSGSTTDRKKKAFIPYRDSVLTWLLKDSLGGNAKTIMVAALSPAEVNYSETLSTLRYANRAKNIINKPTINEDANVKLIRELREEIEKLRTMLHTTNEGKGASLNVAQESAVTEKLHENEVKVEKLTRDWNNKWKETHKIMEERALAFKREGFGIKMESDLPHLICVDDDILSTGVTLYHLNDGRTHVGGDAAKVKQDIVLWGPGIETEHCVLESIEGNVTIHPIAEECYLNGNKIKKPTRLSQGAVVLLGKTNMFRFNHPAEAAKLRQKYASMDNLLSIVPAKELEAPSYLFYNAGLEMERRYREETRQLEEKRKELEIKQEEEARKLEEARKQIELLRSEKVAEEEKKRQEMEETRKHLEIQQKHLRTVKEEQDRAKENAQKELQELKERIQREQEEEKERLDSEMKRLVKLKELHRKRVQNKEHELAKQQQELSKKWEEEKTKIDQQKEEVIRLQNEFEAYKEEAAKAVDCSREVVKDGEAEESRGSDRETSELRALLEQLEREYEEAVKQSQTEILQAKESLKKAEMETLQGKIGLSEGKNALQIQWKKLETLQAKHKKKQEQIQKRMIEVRERLEKAELAEEEELMEQEKSILERKKKRKKVEEATQKLLEMEMKFSKTDSEFKESKEFVDWQNKEEIREFQEQRKILMELLSKHQVALLKASQMVTETKTKLENHVHNEKMLIDPIRESIAKLEKDLEPLSNVEAQLDRKCENFEREMKERKKMLYKQRKRINLLEKQHAQSSGSDVRQGLNPDEVEELENDRQAELELIHKEKDILKEMEEKFKQAQESAELHIGEQCHDLERKKTKITESLESEKKKLANLTAVHQETKEFIEAELQAREEMLKKVKDKVINDKRELAKLDMKQHETAAKAAEELFMMAEVLEKELSENGKKDELSRIREHRQKLQELDRQLRLAERKEKFGKDGDDNQCVLL